MEAGFESMEVNYTFCLFAIFEIVHNKQEGSLCVCVSVETEIEIERQREIKIIKQGQGAWGKWNSSERTACFRAPICKRKISFCSVTPGM